MSSLIRNSVAKMTAYTPGEQPAGTDVIKLNTNENPYPPSPKVLETLTELNAGGLRLYPDPECKLLRKRIAELHGCRPSRVFVGNGSDEALALCTRAFVEDDGSIGYFDPSYSLYPVLADIRGARKYPVDLAKDFTWRMPTDFTCSLFLMTNPNAPTGLLYPHDTVREFCEQLDGVVVIDEAYVDFSDRDCVDLALELENVLVARTLSKSCSLAGLRVGYALGPERLIEALFKVKDSYNLNALSQQLALAALGDVEHMRGNVARIKATRDRLSAALGDMGFTVCVSQANFVWAKPGTVTAAELFASLKDRKIFIRHFPGRQTKDYVRITVGTDAEIDLLLDAIEELA